MESIEPEGNGSAGVSGGRVLLQIAILFGLSVCVFWPEMKLRYPRVSESSDMAHVAALPLAMLLLALLRKSSLQQGIGKNSAWGIGLVLLGLAFHALATWPFSYGYARDLAVLPVWSGIVWVCGGRTLWRRTLPLVLLVFLAVPVGSRVYARLIIRPETYTIAATTKCVEVLPGVQASMHGTDIWYSSRNAEG
ncbi:MAG: archaeosortase/exosortase family protein, partial [Sedimentisphaerales bacterium]|nr:archaeosortase/exosortase family protein [Sedimentisphaerales bacterium]